MKLTTWIYNFLLQALLLTGRLGKKLGSYLSRFIQLLRGAGAIALLGILLSVVSIWLGILSSNKNATQLQQIFDKENVLESAIQSVPEDVIVRIAKVIELDAALTEEGPIRDLARLAKSEEPLKISARKKIDSGNRKLEMEGAEQLLNIAEERTHAMNALNKKVAEDFREAGAAFLVANDYERALKAYHTSTEFDQTNFSGFLTLSELALQRGDFLTAEHAALSIVRLAKSEGANTFFHYFAYSQIVQVYIKWNKPKYGKQYIEALIQGAENTYKNFSLDENEKDKIKMLKISKPPAIFGNENTHVTIFWGGEVDLTYRFENLGGSNWELQVEAIVEDSLAFIARHQLMKSYELYGQYYTVAGDGLQAKKAFEQAIRLSEEQTKKSGKLGLQNKTLSLYDQILKLSILNGLEEQFELKKKMFSLEVDILEEIYQAKNEAQSKGIPINNVKLDRASRIDRSNKKIASFDPIIYNLNRNIAQRNVDIALRYFERKNYQEAIKHITSAISYFKAISDDERKIDEELYLKIALFYSSIFHLIENKPNISCHIMIESDAILHDQIDTIPEKLKTEELEAMYVETERHLSDCDKFLSLKQNDQH